MMEIWIWIIIAWLLSFVFLGKDKINFENIIWLLLPVDMYGISVSGATIKPYMIFSGVLLIRTLIKRDDLPHIKSKWLLTSGFWVISVFLINLLNNQTSSAPKAALILIIIWVCMVIYIDSCDQNVEKDIPNVVIATALGYGIIFIIAYVLMKGGVGLPGIIATTRTEPGIFMLTSNMYEGNLIQTYRLRGFTIDPNILIGTFAFGSVASILKIAKGNGHIKEWLGLFVSGVCILISNSRMGIICLAILVIWSLIAGYRIASTRLKNIIKIGVLFGVIVCIIILIPTDALSVIYESVIDHYENRSGLTDENGRFTIWKNAITVLLDKNALLGLGMGQVRYYTDVGKDCHNTWLALICENGIIVGGAFLIHFIILALKGLLFAYQNARKHSGVFVWNVTVSTLIVMISLISVDHVAYSHLWFGAALLSALEGRQCEKI